MPFFVLGITMIVCVPLNILLLPKVEGILQIFFISITIKLHYLRVQRP